MTATCAASEPAEKSSGIAQRMNALATFRDLARERKTSMIANILRLQARNGNPPLDVLDMIHPRMTGAGGGSHLLIIELAGG